MTDYYGSRVKPDRDHVWVVETSHGMMAFPAFRHRTDEGVWEHVFMKVPGHQYLGDPKLTTMTEFIDSGGAGTYLRMLAHGQVPED